MMKFMNKKLTKKGFTLAELLIVVAILAILVAVSIPIFTSKLHDAKDSTDLANERAAKAAAVVEYMTGDGNDAEGSASAVVYYYDAENGKIESVVSEAKKIDGYNQCGKSGCTGHGAGEKLAADAQADTLIVKVEVASNGTAVSTSWVVPSSIA